MSKILCFHQRNLFCRYNWDRIPLKILRRTGCFIRIWGAQKDEAFSAVFWWIISFSSWWFLALCHFFGFFFYIAHYVNGDFMEKDQRTELHQQPWVTVGSLTLLHLTRCYQSIFFLVFFFHSNLLYWTLCPWCKNSCIFVTGRQKFLKLFVFHLVIAAPAAFVVVNIIWVESHRRVPGSIKCTGTQREWE